ncbi:MAG: tetratricopeptide repeat protein [Gemmatimonadetes bacterium]|nr:tetratricopeptide repeat protein [Gemmatimonadota bacterium]
MRTCAGTSSASGCASSTRRNSRSCRGQPGGRPPPARPARPPLRHPEPRLILDLALVMDSASSAGSLAVMSRLSQFVTEIHRRSLWQVLGIYLAGSWVAYQLTLGLVEGLGLPDWVPPFAIVLFIVFLPVVLATAFVQEGLPGAADARGAVPLYRHPPPGPVERVLRRHPLTWHRAITAGVLAFAVLGLGVTGFMGMRAIGFGPFGTPVTRGELGERGVLVADFEPITGDSLLARVVAEAIRVDLSQSPVLHAVDRTRVGYALERMTRPADTRISGEVAREVAVRLGLGALIEGDVGRAGSGYILSARLVSADSGRVLVAVRASARDSSDLLPAVDQLSARLRERAGESLRTIRDSAPLTQVTTSSLPALRSYLHARELVYAGDVDGALQSFRGALALDSQFAAAHRAIGTIYRNAGRRTDSMLYHLRAAVRQEARLTEWEQHHTRGMLYTATGRIPEAIAEYQRALALDSLDAQALVNLGVAYSLLNDNARVEEYSRRALAIGFRSLSTTYWNLECAQLNQRDFAGAHTTIADAAREHHGSPTLTHMRLRLALAEGDFAGAEQVLDSVASSDLDTPRRLYQLLRGHPERAIAPSDGPADPVGRARGELLRAYAELWVERRPQAAVRRLKAAMWLPALDSVPANDRPDPYAALVLAAAGEPRLARQLIERYEAGVPAELRPWHTAALLAAKGFVYLAEGRPDSAVAALTDAQQHAFCLACLQALRAQVLEAAGQSDSAVAAYERYLDTGWDDRHSVFPNLLPYVPSLAPLAHERAAALREQLGAPEKARAHYASFVALWEHAEPDLQPRVESARRRLARPPAVPR